MPVPTPEEIYDAAEREGRRRLSLSTAELAATGFVAGVTIVFGIAALGVVEGLVEPGAGPGTARVAGALAFGVGLVFLVAGRTELFTENFLDPVAAAIDDRPRRRAALRLTRLWSVTLALNLVGGAVLVAVLTVDGALPEGATDALVRVAEEIASKDWQATLAGAVLAGALVSLLSYMLKGVDSSAAQVLVGYLVGVVLALGPFDHVVVSALHLLFGVWASGTVGYADVAQNVALATVGNLVGGVLLVTLAHTAQVKGR